MWTRNLKNLIQTAVTIRTEGKSGQSEHAFGAEDWSFNYKNPGGYVYDFCMFNAYSSYGFMRTYPTCLYATGGNVQIITSQTTYADSGSGAKLFIGLGSSDQAPDEDDYKLVEMISTVTSKSAACTTARNDDGTITARYDLIFTATADVTVKEIGLFMQAYPQVYSSNTNKPHFILVNRMLLDKPLSVASGEVGRVRFSVTTPKILIGQS